MNHRPRRAFTTIMLGGVLAALLLGGCQGSPTVVPTIDIDVTPRGGTTPQPAEATAAPTRTQAAVSPTATPEHIQGSVVEEVRGVQLDFWHPWQGAAAEQAAAAVDQFNRTNEWGIRVRVRPFYGPSALADAVSQGGSSAPGATGEAGAGETPEVVAAASEQIAAWAAGEGSPDGRLPVADLAPYAADGRVGLSEAEIAAFEPVFWAQDQSGAQRLGLPALRGARVLLYNQSWAKDLGFSEAPGTPQQFKQQACAAAQANNASPSVELNGTGGWLIETDPLTTLSWLAAFGADPIPAAAGEPYAFESDEATAALEFLRGMVTEGCAWVGRSLDKHEYFALRRALFATGSLSDLYDQRGWQELAQSQDEWTVLAFPSVDGEPVVYSAGDSYAVTAADPAERLAGWLFARWMAQPEAAAKLAEALPSLPVSEAVAAQFEDYRANYPWNRIMPLMEGVRPAPSLASWRQARRLLEDAAWQVYHLPPESLPEVLPQLDEAVQELTAGPGD